MCTVQAVAQPHRSLAFIAPSRTHVAPLRNTPRQRPDLNDRSSAPGSNGQTDHSVHLAYLGLTLVWFTANTGQRRPCRAYKAFPFRPLWLRRTFRTGSRLLVTRMM